MLANRRVCLAAFAVLIICLFHSVQVHAQGTYQWSMVAQASPDECFQGNANTGLTPDQVTANKLSFSSHYPAGLSAADIATCTTNGGLPKVNQAYVWGLTMVGKNLWFSTVSNTLCLVMDSYYGSVPSPFQNNSWVCDMPDGEDVKPPRVFVYNSATTSLTDLTAKILAGGGAALLTRTVGLRSAGNFNGVVFFGGLYAATNGKNSVVLYAFNADTQQYLGSYLFDGSDELHPYYNNIRQWHVISNQLFTGVAQPGGGSILRWTGSLANPFSFAVVGQLLGDPAYFVVHNGNIYASTWGAGGLPYGMSLYMSPSLHGDLGLEETDAAGWTEVWNLNQYEVEPSAVQGGGALASFDGYLYWGTMQVPGTGVVAFSQMYSGATVDTNTFINTTRPIAIFRSQGFDPAQVTTPSVDLLYGSAQLPQYDPVGAVWNQVNNNMGQSPLYGLAGFGNIFNNYTWAMEVFQGKLFVGTMDWSFLATNGNESTSVPAIIKSIAPAFYGADLWSFADANSAAVPVSLNGMGNYTSYGIRTMVSDDDALWLGMANPMNLRTDISNNPGGWKLLTFPFQSGAPMITWNNPADITYGTLLGATQLNPTANVQGAFVYSPPAGTLLNAGPNQTLSTTLTPTSSGNQYSKTVSINVKQAPLTVTAADAAMIYGAAVPSLTGSLTGVVNNDGISASYSTTAITTSPVGEYSITSSLDDPNSKLPNYSVTTTDGKLTIGKAGTTSSVSASAASVMLQRNITFTAHVVAATSGTPTGSVNFNDGATSLGSATLDGSGNASLSLSTLAAGSHSITLAYAGDGNFTSSTSPAITEMVQDFQLASGSGVLSASVTRGQAASYSLPVAPTYGSYFPSDITLTLAGLPAGATYTIAPSTITSGSGAQTVTIQVQTSTMTALKRTTPFGMTFFAITLLPIGLIGLRRSKRGAVLAVLTLLALGMLLCGTGCGGNAAKPAPAPVAQNYTMTVTAASGAVQHTVTLNLTVQ
jgi:hypothetical protein